MRVVCERQMSADKQYVREQEDLPSEPIQRATIRHMALRLQAHL